MGRRKVMKDVEHGISASYYKGCRCFACTKANTDKSRKDRGRSLDSPKYGFMGRDTLKKDAPKGGLTNG